MFYLLFTIFFATELRESWLDAVHYIGCFIFCNSAAAMVAKPVVETLLSIFWNSDLGKIIRNIIYNNAGTWVSEKLEMRAQNGSFPPQMDAKKVDSSSLISY